MSALLKASMEAVAKYDRMRAAQNRFFKSKRLDDLKTAKDAEVATDAAMATLRGLLYETPKMTGFDGVEAEPWPGFDEKGVPHA